MQSAQNPTGPEAVETTLARALARGDALVATTGPILRHLLVNDDHSLFSDAIIARVRGALGDIARQLLEAMAAQDEKAEKHAFVGDRIDELATLFGSDIAFLGHIHAMALEFQLSERLQERCGIDPVLSPLLQSLIASSDAGTGGTAMRLLAAQARFLQAQRRMEMPLGELPGDLFHCALQIMQTFAGEAGEGASGAAAAQLRDAYDESDSRIGLLARMVTGMGNGGVAALSLHHAGPALFTTALALASGQDRNLALLAAHDRQAIRLAVMLRASGIKPDAIAEQLALIDPEAQLPPSFEALRRDRAEALLSGAMTFDQHG